MTKSSSPKGQDLLDRLNKEWQYADLYPIAEDDKAYQDFDWQIITKDFVIMHGRETGYAIGMFGNNATSPAEVAAIASKLAGMITESIFWRNIHFGKEGHIVWEPIH